MGSSQTASATANEKVRNTPPIKINEFRTSTGADSTDQFIELYNAGSTAVDLSNWTVTEHPTQQPVFSNVTIPSETTLAAGGHYVLGLSASGLAAPARSGDASINVRSTNGLAVGDQVNIDTGSTVETRTITSIGTAATSSTTLWQPLPDGPVMTVPADATNVPVANVSGFAVGQKLAIGYGKKMEVGTVISVGKPGTQARLSAPAAAGATNIKVTSTDQHHRRGHDPAGHRLEDRECHRCRGGHLRRHRYGP